MNETHLDIFSGLGGFALAARWAGFETVGFCESDSRCREFLGKTWGLPVEPDIRKFDAKIYRGISLLTGGPPCQPASRAGKQGGDGDDRWLWPEALRVLDESRPDSVVFENPPGILDVGLDGILSEMGRLGYEVQCFDIPACAVDSPQLRHRIWIVGFLADASVRIRKCEPCEQGTGHTAENCPGSFHQHTGSNANSLADAAEPGREGRDAERAPDGRGSKCPQSLVADTDGRRFKGVSQQNCESLESEQQASRRNDTYGRDWQNSVWVPCADNKLRRAPDDSFGLVDGLHRSLLGALGNSIVPQVACEILKSVKSVLT